MDEARHVIKNVEPVVHARLKSRLKRTEYLGSRLKWFESLRQKSSLSDGVRPGKPLYMETQQQNPDPARWGACFERDSLHKPV